MFRNELLWNIVSPALIFLYSYLFMFHFNIIALPFHMEIYFRNTSEKCIIAAIRNSFVSSSTETDKKLNYENLSTHQNKKHQ